MTTDWAFLEPWREALNGVIQPPRPNDIKSEGFAAEFECWPNNWRDRRVLSIRYCVLVVKFPAFPAGRQDLGRLQLIREAMEIFDRLAVVDSLAFATLLSDFVPLRPGKAKKPVVYWPEWRCQLDGTLSAEDPAIQKALEQSLMTWGDLFGCPDDTWKSSLEFCRAMQQLEAMGLGDGGDRHNSELFNRCGIEGKVVHVVEYQEVRVKDQDQKPSPMYRGLNSLFKLPVPAAIQLEAVRDHDMLIRAWQQTPQRPGVKPRPGDAIVTVKQTSLCGVYETVAVAQTAKAVLRLELPDVGDRQFESFPTSMANDGFFFSTVICGRSGCLLNDADAEFQSLHGFGRCDMWNATYNGASHFRLSLMFSALAESRAIKHVRVSTVDTYSIHQDPVTWSWLAYAFWSNDSKSSVEALDISLIHLTEQDVFAVEEALKKSYPEGVVDDDVSIAERAVYGYVSCQKGTEVRSIASTGGASSLTLAHACQCRAQCNTIDTDKAANVVIPAYGICSVRLVAGVADFIADTLPVPAFQAATSNGIRSLSLSLADVDDETLVTKLLGLIGGHLGKLVLDFKGVLSRRIGLDLCTLAATCPQLTELHLDDFDLTITGGVEALKKWGLKHLSISGSYTIDGLETCLNDRTYRMSRELLKLGVSPRRHQHSDGGNAFPPHFVASLRAHNGEFLPMTKLKCPRRTKAALLSVLTSGKGTKAVVGNVHELPYLDSNIFMLIFSFAATPERRLVSIVPSIMT